MDELKKLRSPILEIWRRLQGAKKGKEKSPKTNPNATTEEAKK